MARPPASPLPQRPWRDALSSERMAHLVKDAFRGTSRALQLRLRQQSVAYSHWTLLRVLWQTDGITQRQLSEQAGVTEPSAFAALQRMEKLGYVSRRKVGGNGKEVRVFLAPKGAALRTTIVAAAEDVNRVALAGIPAADVEATRRTLLTMIGNLADDDPAEWSTRSLRTSASPAQPRTGAF